MYASECRHIVKYASWNQFLSLYWLPSCFYIHKTAFFASHKSAAKKIVVEFRRAGLVARHLPKLYLRIKTLANYFICLSFPSTLFNFTQLKIIKTIKTKVKKYIFSPFFLNLYTDTVNHFWSFGQLRTATVKAPKTLISITWFPNGKCFLQGLARHPGMNCFQPIKFCPVVHYNYYNTMMTYD